MQLCRDDNWLNFVDRPIAQLHGRWRIRTLVTCFACFPCPWRIRKLRCDRHLEQTAAMVPPSVVIKDGMGGRRFARSFSWSTATERLMNAIFVVINSQLVQLSLQVDCVPD